MKKRKPSRRCLFRRSNKNSDDMIFYQKNWPVYRTFSSLSPLKLTSTECERLFLYLWCQLWLQVLTASQGCPPPMTTWKLAKSHTLGFGKINTHALLYWRLFLRVKLRTFVMEHRILSGGQNSWSCVGSKSTKWKQPKKSFFKMKDCQDFPDGPVVKTPCFHGRGHRLNPWGAKILCTTRSCQKEKNEGPLFCFEWPSPAIHWPERIHLGDLSTKGSLSLVKILGPGEICVDTLSGKKFALLACMCAELLQSCLTLCNLWLVAHRAPLSMEFSGQEYWSVLPCPLSKHKNSL